MFIDTTGPDDPTYPNRMLYEHETFPELVDYLDKKFVFVGSVHDARVYVSAKRYREMRDSLPRSPLKLLG
ncbi:MAG: hypothetical protein JO353_01350 [Phycisphaerae bacterium]|nr:hypothetical protein [Phycisphaerae bacterium]